MKTFDEFLTESLITEIAPIVAAPLLAKGGALVKAAGAGALVKSAGGALAKTAGPGALVKSAGGALVKSPGGALVKSPGGALAKTAGPGALVKSPGGKIVKSPGGALDKLRKLRQLGKDIKFPNLPKLSLKKPGRNNNQNQSAVQKNIQLKGPELKKYDAHRPLTYK